jgi:hypothetical protein
MKPIQLFLLLFLSLGAQAAVTISYTYDAAGNRTSRTYSVSAAVQLKKPLEEPVPIEEEKMGEGNEFSGALAAAKAAGEKEFEVDGKRYTVKEDININVSANGEVSACCWTGFYPIVSLNNPSNNQLRKLIKDNNALIHGLEIAIKWFDQVEASWSQTVPNGKIYACNSTCGS